MLLKDRDKETILETIVVKVRMPEILETWGERNNYNGSHQNRPLNLFI